MTTHSTGTDPESVVFTFDRLIADLVPKYLARCRERQHRIADHLASHEIDDDGFRAVQDLGLELVGSGQPFGFPRISEVGRAIVEGAERHDRAATLEAMDRLRHHLDALDAIRQDVKLP